MTREFEIISEATQKYILCSGAKGYEDLKLMLTLSNIIINIKDRRDNFKFIKKYSFKEIDKLVTNFLEELNPSYREYYEIRKEDGSIIFDNNKENYSDGAFSEYDEIYNNRIIYIPLKGTLEDAFAIVHELFHDINIDEKHKSIARMFCTEGISLLGEMLLEDYLISNKVKDARTSMNNLLYCVKSKAIELHFNINLVLKYLENNYIDVADIMDLIETYPGNYGSDLSFSIQKIVELEDLTIDVEQTYILGALLATYMYDRIKNNKNNINELFELNQELKNYTFGQVLDYLEIKCNNWDFHDDAYKELEKCYKKYIKSR